MVDKDIGFFLILLLATAILCSIIVDWDCQKVERECADYQDYGYVTEFKEDNCKCLVSMEDGTKLPLYDFKATISKEAMVNGK